MTYDIRDLETRRDALLDTVELINTMIYEQRLALERLDKMATGEILGITDDRHDEGATNTQEEDVS